MTHQSLNSFVKGTPAIAQKQPLPTGITAQRVAASISWVKKYFVLPDEYEVRVVLQIY